MIFIILMSGLKTTPLVNRYGTELVYGLMVSLVGLMMVSGRFDLAILTNP
jgi:hypothetical protein